ncbi:endo alpha-1,4 polygalactosaminidase [Microbacterium sp. NPDC058389]|uniref:endo alpha-1,4 polygalactosaminidase n=1 Tax=Microbacterium sp. NPDC058389 TaxID=3346475 RepID=UPI003662D480
MLDSRQPHRARRAAVALALAAGLAGCAGTAPAPHITLPPAGAAPDYQLGVAYQPPDGVGIVARDRTADPAPDLYSICYVNGFQTQPGELDTWPADALLSDHDGDVVFDPEWPDEALLDTSTDAKRALIAGVVEPWILGCAEAGFDAVEFDNLDTYERSDGALTLDDNLALATMLVDAAHGAGLAAAQKNAAEDADLLHEIAGFDFAVAEECTVYDECGLYADAYGAHVIAVEYSDTDVDFAAACADPSAPASLVLRDRDLVGPDDEAYVFALCDGADLRG